MKKHTILISSEASVKINEKTEELISVEVLAKHEIQENDHITFLLNEEIACIELAYEAYDLLKGMGYKNLDFTG